MKKNMGNLDRAIRVSIALIVVALVVFNIVEGVLAILLMVLAGIFVVTSAVSFCPLYTLFGFSTCPVKTEK